MGTIEHTYGRQYCANRACSRTAEHTGEHNYPAWMLPVPTEAELLAAHVGTACSCQTIDREPVGAPVGSAESVPTPADRIRSLITEHDAMGHDGLGCGCLDAIDVIIDSARASDDL